jgi:hypothetical protein
MKLTFPKTHKTEHLRPLYEEFKLLYPDLINEWIKIESKAPYIDEDDLPPISNQVQVFLNSKVENEGPTSLIIAFLDFRKLLVKEYLGYSLSPEGH